MKTKQKAKQEKNWLEDLPAADEAVNPAEEQECKLTKEAIAVVVADSIYEGREAIYQAIDKMIEAIAEDLLDIFKTNGVTEVDLSSLDEYVAGVRKVTIIDLLNHNSDLQSFIKTNKASVESEFLDVNSLKKNTLKHFFPNAFKKWEPEDDAKLTKLYAEGLSWSEISKAMKRNVNAIKIRAEKLGIATETGAKLRY